MLDAFLETIGALGLLAGALIQLQMRTRAGEESGRVRARSSRIDACR
jgi:hypothetical protein